LGFWRGISCEAFDRDSFDGRETVLERVAYLSKSRLSLLSIDQEDRSGNATCISACVRIV
jgi:hypothetical protein